MDVFEKVRQVAPEIDGVDENMAAARTRLIAELHAAPHTAPAASTSRRPWLVAGSLVGAAAAVAAGVLVVVNLTASAPLIEANPTRDPGSTVQPTPSTEPTTEPTTEPVTATTVLTGAASIVAEHPGPIAGPGQYLKIEHLNRQLVLYSPEDPVNSNRAQATAAWVATSSYTSYIPGDRSGEWVDVFHPDLQIVELFGVEAAARSQEWLAQFSWRTEPMIHRYQGGGHPGEPVPGDTYLHYDEMPRDPAALLTWVKAYQTGLEPGTEEMGAVTFLMQELQLGAAPADLRAAMYRALSLIPGGIIAGTEGEIVTLSFPTYPPNERWDSISIDTRTAFVTSVSMTLGSGGTVVPDTVPSNVSTLSITVVKSAP